MSDLPAAHVVAALHAVLSYVEGPIIIVDVGAQSLPGERHVYSALDDLGLPVRVIGFEPQAERAAARRTEESARDVVILEAFVGDGEDAVFHLNNSTGTSSLLALNAEVCSGFMSLSGLRTVGREPVRTARLDDLLADGQAVDLLKLDIQGFELAALRGADSVLRRTGMLQCETEFIPIYENQPLFSEIELHLRARGFEFIDFHAPARRAPAVPSRRIRNDQLLWADSVFAVRAATASDRALLISAILLAALYGKLSIAERALAVYDSRHGTELAALIGALA